MILKLFIINQHDDPYTTLDKTRHLLVGHYVKNDVQSFNIALYIANPKTLHSLQQIMSFELDKKMIFFPIIFITTQS